ncbi:S-adenosyl-L-methionine-dependent methyltransferase [Coniella lustricola]|uniref:S-adenosyl-L-methionine-dependent methyltransferase n=1 Tax=Coniella lustricola TaxID=2025994 RepID=A0A2T2ZU34_9PEZI|nr:S-adenosyl-L-methionine-dependent methyltransferase [Coniella lustricola]
MSDIYSEYMSRHATEADRLDDQFDLMTKNIGFLLHPDVKASLPAKPRVADVATGSGYFLGCVQKLYPDAQLDGFDISPALFPQDVSANTTFRVLDIKQPIPEDLKGQYDLVHVRLLVAAMLPSDWPPVVRNAISLLRPGGWIQWEEGNFVNASYYPGASGSSRTVSARRAGTMFNRALLTRFSTGWNILPDEMRTVGLENVVAEFVSSDRLPETRTALTVNSLIAIFAWMRKMTDQKLPGALDKKDLETLITETYKDVDAGCYVRYDIHIAAGRKPLKE